MADDYVDEVCKSCNIKFFDGENLIQCEGFCQKWVHTKCYKISDDDYQRIIDLGENSHWFCDECMPLIQSFVLKLNTPGELLKLPDLVDKLFNLVKGIVSDNVAINSKLDKVIIENERLSKHVQNLNKEVVSSAEVFSATFVETGDKPQSSGSETSIVDGSTGESKQSTSEEQDNNWTIQQNRKKKNASNLKHNLNSQNENGVGLKSKVKSFANAVRESRLSVKPIIGTKSTTDTPLKIEAVERKAWLFVSRLHPDVDSEKVKTFLTNSGITSVVCEALKPKFDTYASFKVGIPLAQLDSTMSSDFWPSGVLVRRFTQPRQDRPNSFASKVFLPTKQASQVRK